MDIGTILLFVLIAVVPPFIIYGMMFGDEIAARRRKNKK